MNPVASIIKISKSKMALYVVVILLLFCVIGLLSLISSGANTQYFFLLAQILCLGLGIGNLLNMYKYLPIDVKNLLQGLFVTLGLSILGGIFIALIHHFVFKNDGASFATCVVPFTIPYLFWWAYQYYLAIPLAQFKLWHYPAGGTMPDMDLVDLSKILVIQFELSKKISDSNLTNFKAKAPVNLSLAELFLIFMNDYNEQNPTNIIQYSNENNEVSGWLFFKRNKWWQKKHYYDPELTFKENGIVDNDIIVAVRE